MNEISELDALLRESFGYALPDGETKPKEDSDGARVLIRHEGGISMKK